jgi:hypothetical protein
LLLHVSKVNIRLALSRLRLQSTKRQASLKPQKKEIAKLLDEGKEVTARALTEQLIRDEKSLEAYAQLEIFCEQFLARLDAIARESYMPKDLIVCLCSLVYAAPRVDVEELKKVANNLELKYGTLWSDSCHSNLHGQVHPQIFSNLSIGRSPAAIVDEYMTSIAKDYDVDWSPLVPTPTEQDLDATYRAAQSLNASHIKSPHPSNAIASTVDTSKFSSSSSSSNARMGHYSSQNSILTSTMSIQGAHHGFHAPNHTHTSHGSNFQNPSMPSAPSSSPPIEYHRLQGLAGSAIDEELFMIEMLPQPPSNLAVSMDMAPIASEGGVIVTHEHDDDSASLGFTDLSQPIELTEQDLYDEILIGEEIPDGPAFESSPVSFISTLQNGSSHTVASSHSNYSPVAPKTTVVEEEEEEDPLLARFNRLKGR